MPMNLIPDEPNPISKKAEKLRAEINQPIEKLNVDEAAFDDEGQQLATVQPRDYTPQHIERLKTRHGTKLSMRQRKAAFLSRIANEWYPVCEAERTAVAEKLRQVSEDVKVDIRHKLIGMGYVEGFIPGGVILSITPEMVLGHPAVFAARNDAAAAYNLCDLTAQRQANKQELDAVEAEIQKLATQLIS